MVNFWDQNKSTVIQFASNKFEASRNIPSVAAAPLQTNDSFAIQVSVRHTFIQQLHPDEQEFKPSNCLAEYTFFIGNSVA